MYFGNTFVTTCCTCTVLQYVCIVNFKNVYFGKFINTENDVKTGLYFHLAFSGCLLPKYLYFEL